MIIESKLSERDFIKATFVLLYSRLFIKITTALFSFFLISGIIAAIFYPTYSTIQELFFLLLILFVRPVLTYITAKRNYNGSGRSGELIIYTFNADYLSIKGESFNSEFSWDKIYKVSQTKNWVFIWQNKTFANAIPKHDIWEEQIDELKAILETHHVKNNL
ncbi:MAG TPA: YcxB family protein [Ferruginibacter sp.]|nr:YcxB family protein [Ferruginibacter sp.]